MRNHIVLTLGPIPLADFGRLRDDDLDAVGTVSGVGKTAREGRAAAVSIEETSL